MEMEKDSETTYNYDNDCVIEIIVDKNVLDCLNEKYRNIIIIRNNSFEVLSFIKIFKY